MYKINLNMEAILDAEKPIFKLGNKASNTFEELNSITKNRYSNINTEIGSNDSTLRFARSMNLQKFTSTVKTPPKESEKQKFEIPESEFIWNPPYLKKTQIFPSYVRQHHILIQIYHFSNIGYSRRLSYSTNDKRVH